MLGSEGGRAGVGGGLPTTSQFQAQNNSMALFDTYIYVAHKMTETCLLPIVAINKYRVLTQRAITVGLHNPGGIRF